MKALILGSNGQDGFYLTGLLKKEGLEVIGSSRSPGADVQGDAGEYAFVEALVKTHRPDYIFHLAANSTTRHDAIFENNGTIGSGTLYLLESVRLHSPSSVVFLSGSAMQFLNEGKPINEQTAFHASSPYSIARIQSVYAARYYRERFNLKVFVGYFFNHDSPLRSERHVNKKIALAVNRIAGGGKERLVLGDIEVKKEFGFAGDIASAVWTLVNQQNIHEAVIGTGQAYSIRDWVKYCFDSVGLAWEDFVQTDDSFVPEYRILVSDPQKIFSLGWKPEVSFTGLADMMMQG